MLGISIHAAREGGDPRNVFVFDNVGISIHAAREGGDRGLEGSWLFGQDFNPRRP